MTSTGNAFTHPSTTADLYRDGARLAARTSALHQAKVQGRPVAEVIAALAAHQMPDRRPAIIADIGCGRGTSSRVLAERLRPRLLLAIDASAAMLAAARTRIEQARVPTETRYIQADFHRMPLADGACALVVAAFCLYHAPDPHPVITEIARVLAPDGLAILVTKSTDSYRSLDQLVAAAGLDIAAIRRPSLYETAHSGNLAALLAPSLRVIHMEHEEHRFAFTGLDHVAAYLATTPKYELPPGMTGNPDAIATALHARMTDQPIIATSTITYLTSMRGDLP
ncbi:class I SAM-dependent methyltransferase [Nonomuraea sp. NPDC023979]|uniref:class I SAM-dependent methyltransferase n=1 Tax=Nonomuraea sp. NPDC023979 TaxID=3154796 RepID=UPI0033CF83AF